MTGTQELPKRTSHEPADNHQPHPRDLDVFDFFLRWADSHYTVGDGPDLRRLRGHAGDGFLPAACGRAGALSDVHCAAVCLGAGGSGGWHQRVVQWQGCAGEQCRVGTFEK